jgi:hypothetical protein
MNVIALRLDTAACEVVRPKAVRTSIVIRGALALIAQARLVNGFRRFNEFVIRHNATLLHNLSLGSCGTTRAGSGRYFSLSWLADRSRFHHAYALPPLWNPVK